MPQIRGQGAEAAVQLRATAPITRAGARRELETVRLQLQGLNGNHDAQVRLVLDPKGRLLVQAQGAPAPSQEVQVGARERLAELLARVGAPGQEQLNIPVMQKGRLLDLIDQYHKPPASSRSFHGAKAIYGRQQAPAPERVSAQRIDEITAPAQMRQRALASVANRLGLDQGLPLAVATYLEHLGAGDRESRRKADDLKAAADAAAKQLRPPPAVYGQAAPIEIRFGNERPGDHNPLGQMQFDFETALELEQSRAKKIASLHATGALTSERLEVLLQASTTDELNALDKQISDMPSIDAYLAPRGGRSFAKGVEHLFFKMAAGVSREKKFKLGSARVARTLADVFGSARQGAAPGAGGKRWQGLRENLAKLGTRVQALGPAGQQELDLHLEALLDRVDELDQSLHLGEPKELQALREALLQAVQALPGLPQPSRDLLAQLTRQVDRRLTEHQPDRADAQFDQVGDVQRQGQLQAQAEQALAKPNTRAQWTDLLRLFSQHGDFIEGQGMARWLLAPGGQPGPRLRAMVAGFAELSPQALGQMREELAASGRAGLLLMNALRGAAGGPLDPAVNAILHELLPPATVLAALRAEPEQAASDWAAWVRATTLSHGGPISGIAETGRSQMLQAMRQDALVDGYENFLQALALPEKAAIKASLRESEPEFLLLEQFALGARGRAMAPGLTELIGQAATRWQAAQSPAERVQVRAELEQALMQIPQGRRLDDPEVAGLAQAALDALPPEGAAVLAALLPPGIALRGLTAIDSGHWPDVGGRLHDSFRRSIQALNERAEKGLQKLRRREDLPTQAQIESFQRDHALLQGLLLTHASIPENHPSLSRKRLSKAVVTGLQMALAQRSTARQMLMAYPELPGPQKQALEAIAQSDLPRFQRLTDGAYMGPDGLGSLEKPLMSLLDKFPAERPMESAPDFQARLLLPKEIASSLSHVTTKDRPQTLLAALESVWHWDPAQGQRLIDALPAATLRSYGEAIAKSPGQGPALAALKARLQSARSQALEQLQLTARQLTDGEPPVALADLPGLISQAYLQAQAAYELQSTGAGGASAADRPKRAQQSQQTSSEVKDALVAIGAALGKRLDARLLLDAQLPDQTLGLLRLSLIACQSMEGRQHMFKEVGDSFSLPSNAVSSVIEHRFPNHSFPELAKELDEELARFNARLNEGAIDKLRSAPLAPQFEMEFKTFLSGWRSYLEGKYDQGSARHEVLASHLSQDLLMALLPEAESREMETARRLARVYLEPRGESMLRWGGPARGDRGEVVLMRTLMTAAKLNPALAQLLDAEEQRCLGDVKASPAPMSSLLMLDLIQVLRAEERFEAMGRPAGSEVELYGASLNQLLLERPRGMSTRLREASLQDWQSALFAQAPALGTGSTPEQRRVAAAKATESALNAVRLGVGGGLSYSASRDLLKALPRWKADAGVLPLVHETLESVAMAAEAALTAQLVLDVSDLRGRDALQEGRREQARDLIEEDLKMIGQRSDVVTHLRSTVEPDLDRQKGLGALRYLRVLQSSEPAVLEQMSPAARDLMHGLLGPVDYLWTARDIMRQIDLLRA